MQGVYTAMRGNAEGWYYCFRSIEEKSLHLSEIMADLESTVDEVARRAGIASRRRVVSEMSSSIYQSLAKHAQQRQSKQSLQNGTHSRQRHSRSASRSHPNTPVLSRNSLNKPLPPDPLRPIIITDPHHAQEKRKNLYKPPATPSTPYPQELTQTASQPRVLPQDAPRSSHPHGPAQSDSTRNGIPEELLTPRSPPFPTHSERPMENSRIHGRKSSRQESCLALTRTQSSRSVEFNSKRPSPCQSHGSWLDNPSPAPSHRPSREALTGAGEGTSDTPCLPSQQVFGTPNSLSGVLGPESYSSPELEQQATTTAATKGSCNVPSLPPQQVPDTTAMASGYHLSSELEQQATKGAAEGGSHVPSSPPQQILGASTMISGSQLSSGPERQAVTGAAELPCAAVESPEHDEEIQCEAPGSGNMESYTSSRHEMRDSGSNVLISSARASALGFPGSDPEPHSSGSVNLTAAEPRHSISSLTTRSHESMNAHRSPVLPTYTRAQIPPEDVIEPVVKGVPASTKVSPAQDNRTPRLPSKMSPMMEASYETRSSAGNRQSNKSVNVTALPPMSVSNAPQQAKKRHHAFRKPSITAIRDVIFKRPSTNAEISGSSGQVAAL